MGSKVRALIVEDTLELREFLVILLGEEGYLAVAASGPTDARQILGRQPIDLVVTDLIATLPDDPIASARAWLREAGRYAPVVVVTGRAWALDLTASDLGVASLVFKPFDLDDLVACVWAAVAIPRSALAASNAA